MTLQRTLAIAIIVAFLAPARSVATETESASSVFTAKACEILPVEQPYDYHRTLDQGPVHRPRRDAAALPTEGEMALPQEGWTVLFHEEAGPVLRYGTQDFREYLNVSMNVQVGLSQRASLDDWAKQTNVVVVGTKDQLPGLGQTLKGPKDYEIHVSPQQVVVCGFDERGVMYGLFNLEARMSLREGPFLPRDLKTIRHSLYQSRMVLSWLGWNELTRLQRRL